MFARTQRLTLRPAWPEDAAALAKAIAHESVAFKLARLPWPYAEADAAAWIARPQAKCDVTLMILAHEGPTPVLIGGIGIHPDLDHGGHEIGYWLTPSAWGRGYATEAGRAMLGMARHAMGLRHLRSGHFVDNPASGRVLAKLGFRPVGIEPQHCLALGIDKPCVKLERTLADDEGAGSDAETDPARLAA